MKAKLIISFLLIIFMLNLTFAEKQIQGIIDKDTRWSAEDGPFVITGDILVTELASLVISPGTVIIIEEPKRNSDSLPQFDKSDSSLISLKIQGAFSCVGRKDKPIKFIPRNPGFSKFNWRGIVLDRAIDEYTEIAFTEISGASTALTVQSCSPLIRNTLFENNNLAVSCISGGAARISNCIMVRNFTAAVKIELSNPKISNSILAFNNNLGLWCDMRSKIDFEFNCIFGNKDGNFLDCNPEFGILSRVNKNKDSTDRYGNLIMDPVFAGSPSENRAIELDVNLPTDKSKVKDPTLTEIVNSKRPGVPLQPLKNTNDRYTLSKYSPCLNAGNPSKKFCNSDGSLNTMGISGGPDFIGE